MWKLYDDLIEGIPKDILVEDMVVGQYNSLVKSSVGSGIGLVYYDESRPPDFVKEFKGKALHEVAKCIKSWNLTEAGIGLAAINSYYNSIEVVYIFKTFSFFFSSSNNFGDSTIFNNNPFISI